ncbi:uncharacterized protein LOC132950261 [Metopolophium dirhodum]|uniref:uncharacterized protein LOC132950261 n=1 Tax=Metopolophium dirhodum TaxID=44670 RepID=UPI00298F7299|nr:uncharacterized protein LOC132950261 [Metopolophium dirhodum]
MSNIAAQDKKSSDIKLVGWKSTPDSMIPAVDDHRSHMLKPSGSGDVLSFPADKRSVSLPNVAVSENSSGDAPDSELSFGTSAESPVSTELPVSTDSPSRAETSVLALMPPATAEDDCWIKTPLSVSSPSPLVEAGVTDTVTSRGRSDAGTDLAVTTARSLWNRTKLFVRRIFCRGTIDRADE